jgi:hypothetical protein
MTEAKILFPNTLRLRSAHYRKTSLKRNCLLLLSDHFNMPPFWTDERDKTLLLLMLGPERTITRAQAAEIAQMMGAPAPGDTVR